MDELNKTAERNTELEARIGFMLSSRQVTNLLRHVTEPPPLTVIIILIMITVYNNNDIQISR